MGMTIKYTPNPDLVVQMAAGRHRGMQKAGELVLAAAAEGAPREPGAPKHGVHGDETGYVLVESAIERVAIGFTAFWLVFQHERLDYKHTHGHAKFLELALLEHGEAALALIGAGQAEAVA